MPRTKKEYGRIVSRQDTSNPRWYRSLPSIARLPPSGFSTDMPGKYPWIVVETPKRFLRWQVTYRLALKGIRQCTRTQSSTRALGAVQAPPGVGSRYVFQRTLDSIHFV